MHDVSPASLRDSSVRKGRCFAWTDDGTTRRRLIQAGAAGAGMVALGSGTARAVAASGRLPDGAHRRRRTRRRRCSAGSSPTSRRSPTTPPASSRRCSTSAAPGGLLDAQDDLFGPNGGPVKLITDPSLSLVNRNNAARHRGRDLRRPVHRPRPHLRRDLAARRHRPTPAGRPTRRTRPLRPRLGVRRRPGGAVGALRPAAPDQAARRVGRPVRGPPASCGRVGGRRRPAQRLQPDHLRAARGLPAASTTTPSTRSRPRAPTRSTSFTEARAPHDVDLPVAGGQPVPAGVRRTADGRRRPAARAALLPAARRAVHPGRVLRRGLPVRAQHGPAVVPGQPGRRRRPAVLRADLRLARAGAGRSEPDLRPGRPPRRLPRRHAASSAGRPSSTSAAATRRRCAPTR